MSEQTPPTSRLRGFAASFAASARRADDSDGDGDRRSPLLRRLMVLTAVTTVVALAAVGVGFVTNRMAGDVDRTAFARPTVGAATPTPDAAPTTTAPDDQPSGGAGNGPGDPARPAVDPVAVPGTNAAGDPPSTAAAGGSGTPSPNSTTGSTTTGTTSSGSTASRTTAAPAPALPTGTIVSFSTSKCIDVDGGRGRDGARLHIWDCIGVASQRWTFQNGTVRTMGLCMDAAGGSMADGTPIQLANCNGGQAQRWTLNKAHDLVNTVTGRCIDVRDKGTANGTRLQLWACSGTGNQKWRLQ
ncbi:RICIN domain-containing protein [Micromonospora sp. NBC_01813]|uniref:RICIN domain-containing protein n=1 Tax=Micromonospora sp. NBC_01813 TaxID=2975988 RepID=UPI002DDAC2CD|nr:ricin-type beta-trefoil lectin domain protein [Micromonospora sp. NBC_01813]WSA12056.1 ricin-type beta-trefoil lectin domain protein [Micromonospora sp. NBC_01813]